MTRRGKKDHKSDHGGVTHFEKWTRDEQIENAIVDGTVEEMKPPLTGKERNDREIPRP